jgi:hypothetical protein
MAASLAEIQTSLEAAQARLPTVLDTARTGLDLLVVLILLSQVPPLYDGYRLLAEQGERFEKAPSETPQDPEESETDIVDE